MIETKKVDYKHKMRYNGKHIGPVHTIRNNHTLARYS